VPGLQDAAALRLDDLIEPVELVEEPLAKLGKGGPKTMSAMADITRRMFVGEMALAPETNSTHLNSGAEARIHGQSSSP
jgi:hypothetical protein